MRHFSNINSVALTQCTWGQPQAAIAALDQYDRQEKGNLNTHLIVIDSNEDPKMFGPARAFYEPICAEREDVHYLHIPRRPGHDPFGYEDTVQFPNSYSWQTNADLIEIWGEMPTDDRLRSAYKTQEYLSALNRYDRPTIHRIMSASGTDDGNAFLQSPQVTDAWRAAVDRYDFHSRPHLGSKRNFTHAFAKTLGCDAAVYLDDDWLDSSYLKDQVKRLAKADFTALTQYPVYVLTHQMIHTDKQPIWGQCDQNFVGPNVIDIEPDGTQRPATAENKMPPYGFSYALRLDGLPPAAHILGGEDREWLARVKADGFICKPEFKYTPTVARLVFGHSNSPNRVTKVLKDLEIDQSIPEQMRRDVSEYVQQLMGLQQYTLAT